MLEDRAQEESESDELNRPKYKVLMLSGFGFKISKFRFLIFENCDFFRASKTPYQVPLA